VVATVPPPPIPDGPGTSGRIFAHILFASMGRPSRACAYWVRNWRYKATLYYRAREGFDEVQKPMVQV
jgi:hypothetical protein